MLVVTRKHEETWRKCVIRYAKPFGLVIEALVEFDCCLYRDGEAEETAAWNALYEWDLLDFKDVADGKPRAREEK